jgi:hypothetical protein
LAAIVAVSTVGCSGGGGPPKPKDLNKSQLLGAWTEIKDAAPAAGRFAAAPAATKNVRKITFNNDGTFKFELLDEAGNPLKSNNSAEGTWTTQGRVALLKLSKNDLNKSKPLGPAEDASITLDAAAGICYLPTEGGDVIQFKKSG